MSQQAQLRSDKGSCPPQENKGAAWYYANPKDAAKNIKGYVAFWKGVKVE